MPNGKQNKIKMDSRLNTSGMTENEGGESGIFYREAPLSLGANGSPATLDKELRSVEVVGATENPVPVYDWLRDEVINEILLMSGCKIPNSNQTPLLDTHSRFDTSSVIGSFREIRIENNKLIGRAYFSSAEEAQNPFLKVQEGHLTDFSVGYKPVETIYVKAGQRQAIDGREYEGPVRITTQWMLKELSICAIGADVNAKARAMVPSNFKEEAMDKKVRDFLISRGLPQDATEEEAYKFLERLDVLKEESAAGRAEGGGQEVKVEEAVKIAVRAEQERMFEIRAMCGQANLLEEADKLIKENKSVDQARAVIFDRLVATAPTKGGAGYRGPIEMGRDERDKFMSAATDALLIRSGARIEKPADGSRDIVGYSLREMARESLRIAGKQSGGDVMEMLGRALTTSDLPYILSNVANKSLFEGFETAPESWLTWCETGSVSDFKTNTSVRASETDDLDEIREEDEYKYGSMKEGKEEYKIATYGKLFKITRQTLINDDLSVLTDTPRKHGVAASRKIGDIVYAVPTANSAMGDGVALFHADHGNIGTGGVPGETTIAEAIKKMKLQKDLNGKRRLNIRPQFFIAPVALEGSAEVFFNSMQYAGDNKAATRVNPYAGSYFQRVYEARLDDTSETAWYLAGPKGKTVKVFFLNGNSTPYLEQKEGWNVDGVEFKVRIDAGAKAMDWKALVKNTGV